MRGVGRLAAAFAVALVCGSAAALAKQDRHAGYYYPPPQTIEVYTARATELPDIGRKQRLAFVTGFTVRQQERPYPPHIAMFAKGDDAQKLIIVGLANGRLDTLYRARAMLAMMTATARTTPIFREYEVEEIFTFLDLCKMLGFKQITVSDGKDFAHQILIE